MKIPLVDICDFKGGTQPPKDEWIDHEEPGYIRMLQIRDFTQSEKNNIEYVKDTSNLKNDEIVGKTNTVFDLHLLVIVKIFNQKFPKRNEKMKN